DVTPSDADGTWPLSYGQERLWFLDRLEPGLCLYNVAFAVELDAAVGTSGLDPAVLDAALSAVVRRHRVLHTVYGDRDGVPFQRLRSIPDGLLRVDAVESDDDLDQRVAAVARRPFDLGRDLMLRALLVRTPERQVLALVIHHIAFDGWSVDVLLNDLRDAVGGLLDGVVDPLPALPIEITDHACWQRRWLDEASLGEGLGQWTERLAELPPLALPTDRPRPAIARFRGARHRFDIPAADAVALRRLGRQLGATPFMTTFAAFQALLARWSGQDDFAIGTPSAGRDQPGTAPLVGFFVNTLVLRGDLGGDPSFRELVERARRVAIDAFGRQDVPFEHVVDAVVPERSLAYNPLAQVFFAVQTPQLPDELAPGVGLTVFDVATGTSKFDLTLTLEARGDGYRGLFEYDRDLFDATTIARMARALCRLIDAVVEDPSRRLGELPLLDAAQHHHVVAEHARRDDTPPAPTTLDVQVLAHAARDGSTIAIVDGAAAIDFATLDRRSRRLAERLVAAGCRPEEPIGLALDRSLDLIVAMLGVLRAGGAYLPLDPAHPDERRRYLVDDAGLRLVVVATDDAAAGDAANDDVAADTAAAPAWLDGSAVRRLALDDEPPTGEPLPVGDPAGLAYVLYTSGSTGRPKGVACGHAGVGRLLADFDERAAIAPGDRCAWWTSPNFDVSVYEIFSALTAGATLVVVPESVRSDGAAFASWLDRERIASAYVPPFLLAELAASLDDGARPPLRRLLVGVEPIAESLLLAIRQRLDGLEVINGYGPTEATVCSTLHRVAGVAGAGATPIGRPVLGTTVDLLDRQLRPVPPGVAGEVHLGGDGLARGYFGRPALTAERFVPDPFAGRWGRAPGARVYRTGDLARRRHDGIHCFVGRRDFQVKLFGHRIELGEIETALDRHPAVARSVVVLREDTPGRPRLVAYVTGDAPEPRTLREHLRDRLPDYMVPASIVILGALPVTPNGKVDRRALPAPIDDAATESVAARTPTEVALVEIYRDVLDIEAARPLGVDDDFFGLGGHSLLAARVSARVQQRFDIELPLHDVFGHPTVAELARRIDASASSTRSATDPDDVAHDGASVPLTFGQSRLWFLERLEPGTTRYNMPFGFDLDGPLDAEALRS
ncbi:MAG: amino acid adenylation domain-containing protein, partial [Acidobacteriota bacterium]